MEELIKIMQDIKEKHGIKVRFMIGLTDEEDAIMIRHTADADDKDCGPIQGGARVPFENGGIKERLKSTYSAINAHFEWLGDDHDPDSVGRHGFNNETFHTMNSEHKK